MNEPLQPLVRPFPPTTNHYPEDIRRLQEALASAGYTASGPDVEWAWSMYSEDYFAAGWLYVDGRSPEELARVLRMYLVPPGDTPTC